MPNENKNNIDILSELENIEKSNNFTLDDIILEVESDNIEKIDELEVIKEKK